ncbi:universal stress protein [Hyphomicrobium sp.]|uniref:universal stress protein n=1 Tax=Hyphomicrobium sp. TaxID=82 RepID=UPI002E361DA3|nr:universal stress protein [Hyphomicrobium sp.]HEX2839992.1 universal stress protein [Hyphomicrobium sp.]
MKRMLVVVDGSVQAGLALDRALEIASALSGSELILLNIMAPLTPWQIHRDASAMSAATSARVTALAMARAKVAGVSARARVEAGEKATIAVRIAREEQCDHIFLPERETTPVARALMNLTGLCANTAANRVLSLSSVPVTVVAHEARADA